MTITEQSQPAQTKLEQQSEARRRRAAQRVHELNRLLAGRPELTGVYQPADFAAEAIRWSA